VSLLAVKLLLAPSFVVLASAVARRFGTRLGGAVGGSPVIAAAILLVLGIEHGAAFARDAATATLLAVVALTVFVLVYARASTSRDWPLALVAAWIAYGAALVVLREVSVDPIVALVLACSSCGAALVVLPHAPSQPVDTGPQPRWDIPLRAVSALALVFAVTASAALLGPHSSGLLTAFPMITAILAAFTHSQRGPRDTAVLLRGFSLSFIGYALFCFTIGVTVERVTLAESFAIASVAALAASVAAISLDSRRGDATRAERT
jgi:hypothetical protein